MAKTEPERALRRPRAIVVCGLPGVGKTTVAEHVADRVDGVLLRTDVVRKDLFSNPLYTAAETDRVYAAMFDRARRALDAGDCVVLDGTFRDADYRDRAESLAAETDAEFTLLRVECDDAVVRERIAARTDDASDADVEVYDELRDSFEPCSHDHVTVNNSGGMDRLNRQLNQVF